MTQAGWDCRLAIRDGSTSTVPALEEAGLEMIDLTGPASAEPQFLSEAVPDGVDLLIVDHYGRDRAYEEGCRGWARHIAVIDDFPHRPHDCDLLIDPTLDRQSAAYRDLVPGGCRVLTGVDYAILRPEFHHARLDKLRRRDVHRPLERILVSFGMADPDNLAGRALGAMSESGITAAVDVVLGSNAPHRTEVEAAHHALPGGGSLRGYVENMASLMAQADLAIGGAGSSAWERCCLGLPTLLVVLADNQCDIATGLERRGAAESLGRPEDGAFDRLAERIATLAREPDERARMSAAAAEVCDGKGSQRLIEAFAALSHG